MKINTFFAELKRRKVYKAAIAAMERTANRCTTHRSLDQKGRKLSILKPWSSSGGVYFRKNCANDAPYVPH